MVTSLPPLPSAGAGPVLDDLVRFLGDSPTPYHAVASATSRLDAAGFLPLLEEASWSGLAKGRYYVVHGDSAVVAFVLPDPGAAQRLRGFRIVGGHTDSPNLRLKPKAEYVKEGYAQLGVEVYGGALLNSWLDRDLSLAGRVLVRSEDGVIGSRLVKIDRPLCRIPQLAIHLDRDVNEKGVVLNKQEHIVPILGLAGEGDDILAMCAHETGAERTSIVLTDLMLFDVVRPAVAGRNRELLFSARLDNLAMCHAAVTALVLSAASAEASDLVPVAALFDHEEVGSQSVTGAGSAFLPRVLERILLARGASQDDVHRAHAASMCVSADMAHAVHPNYPDRHESRHKPVLNGGPVIKVNAQQRYATSARTSALFAELCRAIDVPVQHFVTRTDLPCGSTIGPITSTLLGIPTIDVGNPMLSMHSIRELGGTKDPEMMTRALARFFVHANGP
jgi:aspartyl aminopeptidase